jgi:hypothetical protein
MPKTPAPVVGFPTCSCELCGKPTDLLDLKLCQQCWQFRGFVLGYLQHLLANPLAAPKVRELLGQALNPPPAEPEPPKAA